MVRFDRKRLVFGLFVLAFIVAGELVCAKLQVPSWPAYVPWVLFFIEDMNPKKAPPILVGAIVAVGLILLSPVAIGFLAKGVGPDLGRLIYILAAVYSIVAFGEMVPLFLNNFTFMFVTVCGIALQTPNPNPVTWMIVAAVGGGALIGGTILVGKMMGAPAH